MRYIFDILVAFGTLATFSGVGLAQTGDRAIVDLGPLGGDWSRPYTVTTDGTIVGSSENGSLENYYEAFIWTRTDGMTSLGTLGGHQSKARCMNEAGVITGWASTSQDPDGYVAMIWDATNRMRSIGALGGRRSKARWINEQGTVVGIAHDDRSRPRAFVWEETSGMCDLGTLGGGRSEAYCVNQIGQIAGRATDPADHDRAFFWDESIGMIDLGTFGGDESFGYSINDAGYVVGDATLPSSAFHGFIWHIDTGMVDIGTLGGGSARPRSINNQNFVVGRSKIANGQWHAFGWMSQSGMFDLNDLLPRNSGWTLLEGRHVSNDGYIVGIGSIDGANHAFLLTPKLRIDPPTPGVAGVENHWRVSGALPQSEIHFLYSLTTGHTSVPECPGVRFSVRRPQLFGSAMSIGSIAELSTMVPQGATGRSVLFQALDQNGCRVSDVAEITFK